MHIISRKKLKEFWERHADVEQPLRAWYADAKHADWKDSSDISSVVFIPFIGTHQGYDKIRRRHDLTTCAAWGIMACCWQLAIG